MAFYEMLPGAGMPPGLQAGMDSVLNKKFGTSTTYPAENWPDTVNLMGPLPEKTASGAIVTFPDGADAVPLKKCEITLPASLDGYSEVDVVATGKNLFNLVPYLATAYNTPLFADCMFIRAGTYQFSFSELSDASQNVATSWRYCITIYDKMGALVTDSSPSPLLTYRSTLSSYANGSNSTAKSISLSFANDCYIFVRFWSGDVTADMTAKNCQLEVGSTASTFEPYSGTTHTASLGRTIHGGTADVVNGQGTDSYDKGSMSSAYLSGLNSDYIGYEASTAYFGGHPSVWVRNWNYSRAKARQSGGIGCVCNYFPISMHNTTIFSAQYRIYFDVNGKNISSVADFIAFVQSLEANNESLDIVYELNDTYTTDFTFDHVPIDSKLGNNTIWSEQGSDTEVTYRGQGTITPILPTLVTKTITENGTYSAEDDDADGYSEVTVNVESLAKIGINSGKLNISNGEITADSAWCYTDTFDCPSGTITLDVGEGIVSDFAGIELIYESDGSHANYWQGNNRFREVDLTNYYSATKKARLAFKKQYLSKVLLMDFGNGKIYSSLTVSQFVEET